MQKIDIVVTYLNSKDEQWQKDFNYYKELELGNHSQSLSNRQAFGVERTREWNFFKYWFRGVEKNCPWINKVFVVVQNERHIPSWLDKDNPKLRIVYHDEFLPKELLPCFNALPISFYLSNIKDLSENFLYSDDDMFFINYTFPTEFFTEEGDIVYDVRKKPYQLCTNPNDNWNMILNNNSIFLSQFMKDEKCLYRYSHSVDPRSKKTEQELINKYKDLFLNSFKSSKFRNKTNFNAYLFTDYLKIGKQETSIRRINNSVYFSITSRINPFYYKDKEIICFNDTQDMDDFDKCHANVMSFLSTMFPKKSSFEKEEEKKPLKICFGVPSYIPDKEPDRSLRKERLNRMFTQITDIFGDVDWLIVAQNWKEYKQPDFIKNIKIRNKDKLGILGARKELRRFFLDEDYDYLIMLDDDIILKTNDNFSKEYFFGELNNHPDGFVFLKYGWSLTFCAISRYIYEREDMVDIDPEKGEGYEDVVFPFLLHFKYPTNEFILHGIEFVQHLNENRKELPSTWSRNAINKGITHQKLLLATNFHVNRFKNGIFKIDKEAAKKQIERFDWYDKAVWMGWCPREEYNRYMAQFKKVEAR